MIAFNLKRRIFIKYFHFEQLASVSNEKLKHESATRMLLKIEWITVVCNYTIGHHVFLLWIVLLHMNTCLLLHTRIVLNLRSATNEYKKKESHAKWIENFFFFIINYLLELYNSRVFITQRRTLFINKPYYFRWLEVKMKIRTIGRVNIIGWC